MYNTCEFLKLEDGALLDHVLVRWSHHGGTSPGPTLGHEADEGGDVEEEEESADD